MKLFLFDDRSPGSPFMLPAGMRLFSRLVEFIRSKYRIFGYDEVSTPQIFSDALWKTSGHWEHYRDDMFHVTPGNQKPSTCASCAPPPPAQVLGDSNKAETMSLKPMNCPSHCIIFNHMNRSFRDLPLRFADFSPLHRNEAAGALSGLTRVRRFHQDDAHIFCTEDQVAGEISNTLNFVKEVYSAFGFTQFDIRLSTRPDSFVGKKEEWDRAEDQLKQSLDTFGAKWSLNEGDGAFYGPKIDIAITDALGRAHQTATVQLDFQMPQRFDLTYTDHHNAKQRPVMIHRAVLGSVERMMAILLEHTGGKLPFFISPRQVLVISVSDPHIAYARTVTQRLRAEGFHVDEDVASETVKLKIRKGALLRYNFIVLVGEQESANGTVTVRNLGGEMVGTKPVQAFIEELRLLMTQSK